MLKAISISTITSSRATTIKKEVSDFLGLNIGDEILYILDKNGIINIRKFRGNTILENGEKYVSVALITPSMSIAITSEVRQYVNAAIGDQILWILDNTGNIILRNTVILGECSKNIFNKYVTALIIDISSFVRQSNNTSISKEIVDILGLFEGDKITFLLDKYGNIVVSKETGENLLQESTINRKYPTIYTTRKVLEILKPTDKIMWFFDEEGNVLIKNNLLPDICI